MYPPTHTRAHTRPQTHVFAHLVTPAAYASPAAWVTARLACRVMEELLQPDVYDAQLVGGGGWLGRLALRLVRQLAAVGVAVAWGLVLGLKPALFLAGNSPPLQDHARGHPQ